MNLLFVILLIFAVRLASVFVVRTYYVPDEYWQSLEVAHKLTFGYGYLTWEWVQGIRSYVYPLVIAGVYKLLSIFNLDTAHLLVILPRILQATLSAYSDFRFYVWTGKKKWALFLIIVPWFWFYTGSRTLANTLETSLTTIALSYFPWYGESVAYLWPAAICCYLRPTAAIIWIPLCIYHLRKTRLSAIELLLKYYLPIGLLVAGIGIAIDTYAHGKFVVTPYEFLKYNVYHNIGSFYGAHPWYWYFTVGLPTVLGINMLPFIFGIIETVRNSHVYPIRKNLLISILFSLVALSVVDHKEFRFVASLLPLCLYISSDTLTRWSYDASRTMLWISAAIIVFGNVIPAWYLSTVHQKGPIDVMPKLQEIARDYRDENQNRANIMFLMPCHSTPYYSHIHENVTMRFLTCEPNLKNKPNYKDEADQFFESPTHWIRSHIPSYPRKAMPSHLVLFEPLASKIKDFLLNYKLLFKIAHNDNNDVKIPNILPDNWQLLVKEKQIKLQTLIEQMQAKAGRNILVYQRIRDGEENAFNRDQSRATDNGNLNDHEDDQQQQQNLFN